MKIGYCTWGMPEVEMDEAIPYLANLGYDGVEITVIPGYTTELSTLTSKERSRIKTLFTNHGLIMIFWAITPGLIGAFGNLCIPLMIGARDMAFRVGLSFVQIDD